MGGRGTSLRPQTTSTSCHQDPASGVGLPRTTDSPWPVQVPASRLLVHHHFATLTVTVNKPPIHPPRPPNQLSQLVEALGNPTALLPCCLLLCCFAAWLPAVLKLGAPLLVVGGTHTQELDHRLAQQPHVTPFRVLQHVLILVPTKWWPCGSSSRRRRRR